MAPQAITEHPSHEGQQTSVDGIGLGQLARRAGKVARLARIDPGNPQPAVAAGFEQGLFVAPNGFHHDPLRAHRLQTLDEIADTRPSVGKPRHTRPPLHCQSRLALPASIPAAAMPDLR